MIAIVSCLPYDEGVLSDSIDNAHPAEGSELNKNLKIKALIVLKKLLLLHHLKGGN